MRSPRIRKITLLALLSVVLGTAGGAYAAFTSSTSNSGNSFTAAPSFSSCSAGSQTVIATQDTYVEQQNPTVSFGTSTVLQVKSWKQGGGSFRNIRSLVQFPLPAVPADCTVSGATMTLTTNVGTAGRTLEAFRAGAAWSETTTWNTQPGVAGTAATAPSASSGPVSFDVTAQTQTLYSGTNNGFLIRDSVEDAANIGQSFDSREATSDQPTLTVSWN